MANSGLRWFVQLVPRSVPYTLGCAIGRDDARIAVSAKLKQKIKTVNINVQP